MSVLELNRVVSMPEAAARYPIGWHRQRTPVMTESADEAFANQHGGYKTPTEASEKQQRCHQAKDRDKGLRDYVEQDQRRQN